MKDFEEYSPSKEFLDYCINLKGLHTVEINLEDDFSNSCAYHVDDLKTTLKRNIYHAENPLINGRWVLIALGSSLDDALKKCEEIQFNLCKKYNKKILNGF